MARGLGCAGVNVASPADLADGLTKALAADQPTVVDIETSVSEAAVAKFMESSATARALMEAAAA